MNTVWQWIVPWMQHFFSQNFTMIFFTLRPWFSTIHRYQKCGLMTWAIVKYTFTSLQVRIFPLWPADISNAEENTCHHSPVSSTVIHLYITLHINCRYNVVHQIKYFIPASSCSHPQRPGSLCTPFPILASPLLASQSSHLEMALDSVALPTSIIHQQVICLHQRWNFSN